MSSNQYGLLLDTKQRLKEIGSVAIHSASDKHVLAAVFACVPRIPWAASYFSLPACRVKLSQAQNVNATTDWHHRKSHESQWFSRTRGSLHDFEKKLKRKCKVIKESRESHFPELKQKVEPQHGKPKTAQKLLRREI